MTITQSRKNRYSRMVGYTGFSLPIGLFSFRCAQHCMTGTKDYFSDIIRFL